MATVGGRYVLERLLGAGAYGEAQLALDTRDRLQRVVVKLLHAHLVADAEAFERFRREVAVLARLTHPNVVRLLDWGRCPDLGRPFYVTAWSSGRPLDRVLAERGRLEVAAGVRLLDQLLGVLVETEALGVVHRDLKPQNLLLEAEGTEAERLVVLDFGLSRSLADEVGALTAGRAVGTPAYMAPEQCLGQLAGARADVYGAGCVLFELLAGRPVFTAADSYRLLQLHASAPPPDLGTVRPDVPRWLADLVAACLTKDPALRPGAAVVRSRLRPHLSPAAALPPPAGSIDREAPTVLEDGHAPAPSGDLTTSVDREASTVLEDGRAPP